MERAAYEKLRWRCVRRGMLELDVALERFLNEVFDELSEEEQQAFAELADYDDLQLWHLVSGQVECEQAHLKPVLARLQVQR